MSNAVQSPALPIVLLNGYLGAGKTTLLNRLLEELGGRKIAILVNDFGSINVDAGLIDGAVDGVVALQDGCICCSMAAGMQKAIYQVLKREPRPDAILIEASGVSNPADIARTLNDPEMRPYARLELVVTLVDCEHFLSYGDAQMDLINAQIMSADVCVLTKTDLVDDAVVTNIHQSIQKLQPGVLMIDQQQYPLSLDFVLGQSGLSKGAQVMGKLNDIQSFNDAHALYKSWIFQSSDPLSNQDLQRLLTDLPIGTIRGKGELYLAQYPGDRFLLQMVGKRVKVEPSGVWGMAKPHSKIVFIALKV